MRGGGRQRVGGIEAADLVGKRATTGDDNNPLPGAGGRECLPDGSERAGDLAEGAADLEDSQ